MISGKILLLLQRVYIIVTLCLAACPASAQAQVKAGDYQENASFLSRRFLTDTDNAASLTEDFLPKVNKFYKTPFLFPNGGLLTSTGLLDHAPDAAGIFAHRVGVYEGVKGIEFTVMPYLSGYSLQDTAHAANLRLDLSKAEVRANIVAECLRYVSNRVPGGYVRSLLKEPLREFDGVVIDIEPAGDPAFFASLKKLMEEIRFAFDAKGLTEKKIGVAAPQYTAKTPKPNWGWNASDYYYMARYVDYVIAMTYDSGLDKPEYQSWMADQTTHILQAVSGAAWGFDKAHPQPIHHVKVFLGLPGFYTQTRAHDPKVENVAQGAPGILAGLAATHAKSRQYFQGAAMYAHDGGAASSMYARYDQDWSWWLKDWLGR